MLRHRIFEVLKRLEVLGISPVDPRFAKSAVHAIDGVDAFNFTVQGAECFFELFLAVSYTHLQLPTKA